MTIKVRLAAENDISRIAEITHDFEPQTIEGYRNAFYKQVLQNTEQDSNAYIFVALIDEYIVGHGKLFYFNDQKHDVDFESPQGWYLNGIIVDPEYRRRGVARKLLKARESFAFHYKSGQDIYSIVSAENVPSINYHLNSGFVEDKRAPGFLNVRLKCGEGILFRKMLKL